MSTPVSRLANSQEELTSHQVAQPQHTVQLVQQQQLPAQVRATPIPSHVALEQEDLSDLEALDITPQSIVATVDLACPLDLNSVVLRTRNAEYNPERLAAVVMRIRDPETTALVFASGKMVVTGAKSENDSRLAARKHARAIQKLGFEVKFTDNKTHDDVKFPVRLGEERDWDNFLERTGCLENAETADAVAKPARLRLS